MSLPDGIDIYVDTCFLMLEQGRKALLSMRSELEKHHERVKVILTVQQELELQRDLRHQGAVSALKLLAKEPDLFEILPRFLSPEVDLMEQLGKDRLHADGVFRRIAICAEDCGLKVRFLTADMALADALSLYRGVEVIFVHGSCDSCTDWQSIKKEGIRLACKGLSARLRKRDVVLTASGLMSPFIEQFLHNVASLSPAPEHRLLLHECSLQYVVAEGFISAGVMSLLENPNVVRLLGDVETPFRTEAALLDATYFARVCGRDVWMITSDCALANRYNVRTRAHELRADKVSFLTLNAFGEPQPLLHGWKWLRLVEQNARMAGARLPEDDAHACQAELPLQMDAPCRPDAERMPLVAKIHGPTLAKMMRAKEDKTLQNYLHKDEDLRALAVLYACRWGREKLLRILLKDCKSLPLYCFEYWFTPAPTRTDAMSARQLLESPAFYELLRQVVRLCRDLPQASRPMRTLAQLALLPQVETANRARAIIAMATARGAVAATVRGKLPVLSPEVPPVKVPPKKKKVQDYTLASEHTAALYEMARGGFAEKIAARVAGNPDYRALAVLVARRAGAMAVAEYLLRDDSPLPSYCFNNWFSRISGNKKSLPARDMLLRDDCYCLTRRVVELSSEISECLRSMCTLSNFRSDPEPIVRSRVYEIASLAAKRGAKMLKVLSISENASFHLTK